MGKEVEVVDAVERRWVRSLYGADVFDPGPATYEEIEAFLAYRAGVHRDEARDADGRCWECGTEAEEVTRDGSCRGCVAKELGNWRGQREAASEFLQLAVRRAREDLDDDEIHREVEVGLSFPRGLEF